MSSLFDPIVDDVQFYTYHRNPTQSEIRCGYGAIHYMDFPESAVLKKGWRIKKWTKGPDGLRYYR